MDSLAITTVRYASKRLLKNHNSCKSIKNYSVKVYTTRLGRPNRDKQNSGLFSNYEDNILKHFTYVAYFELSQF
jgi:hypothetical protein